MAAFQAVIGPESLKSFTKSLACLARYGDEVIIQAQPNGLILSATNSAKTAFCSVRLAPEFFQKYRFDIAKPPTLTFQTPPDTSDAVRVTGQLHVKSLLSILKHRTVEKTVDRCILSIVEGDDAEQPADAEEDSLESRLVVRLHCKHGVIKTHRLLLLTPTEIVAPQIKPSPTESQVTVGPRVLKDFLDHFPHARGAKSDPELVWLFAPNHVKVKSIETGGGKGRSEISTAVTMSADEFDAYSVCDPPVSIAFFLREFNATIALAESLSVSLDLRFTEPSAPIFIEFDTDASDSEFLFIISTTQTVYDDTASSSKPSGAANLRKRDREEDNNERAPGNGEGSPRAAKKKPIRAAITEAMPAPPTLPRRPSRTSLRAADGPAVEQTKAAEPLFMPGASQLSNADMEVLRASGLGIEHMDYEEFEAMMEAEGEEVGMSTAIGGVLRGEGGADADADAVMDCEQEFAPTQGLPERRGDKEFRPLFDD